MSQLALPTKNKWENALTKLAILVSILMIVGGAIGMVLLQKDLQQSQDWRQQASVADGQVEVTTSAPAFEIGETSPVTFSINTHGVQTDGVQLTFNIVTDVVSASPVFALKPGVALQIAYSEIETTSDGFLVSVITIPSTIGQGFSTNGSTPFAELSLTPTKAGNIVFNFDIENSISTVHATNPPDDELTHIPTSTFTVAGLVASPSVSPSPSASPSVSPSPSASPAVSPSVSPSPSPSATPSVSPSPSASPSVGGNNEVQTCNESCASNSDCDNNLRCYSGQCRLVTNVTSTSCSTPADKGLSFSCNEYCADTRECADDLTCQSNRCRNPENLNSESCSTLTVAQKTSLVRSCNESCNSNSDCDVNLRCYQGACRLATNPSSFSCSVPTAKTVSSAIYGNTKGDGSTSTSTRSAKPAVGTVDTSKTTKTNNGTTNVGSNLDKNGNVIAEEKTALDTVKNYFLANPQIPMIIMGIGLGLILLLVLLSILKRASRRRPPTPPTSGGMSVSQTSQVQKTAPVYEQNLQSKINALKSQPHDSKPMAEKTEIKIPESKPVFITPATVTPPVAAAPPVTAAPETPVAQSTPQKEFLPPSTMKSMSQTVDANQAGQISQASTTSTTEVFSAPQITQPTAMPSTSQPTASEPVVSNQPQSMLERLKSRNVTPPTV